MPKYRVELSDGRKFEVDADGQPSEEDILAALDTDAPSAPAPSPARSIATTALDVGKGFVKGAASTIPNTATGLGPLLNKLSTLTGAARPLPQEGMADVEQALSPLRPTNTAQRIGGHMETAAELLSGIGPLRRGVVAGAKKLLPAKAPALATPAERATSTVRAAIQRQAAEQLRGVPAPKPAVPAPKIPNVGTTVPKVGADPADDTITQFTKMMGGKGAKVSEEVAAPAIDAAVAANDVPAAAAAIQKHVKLTVNEFAQNMRRQFGSQRAGDYMFPGLSRAERKAAITRLAPGPSRTPLIVEEAKAAAAARRAAALDRAGEEGFSGIGAMSSLAGGAVGGLTGAALDDEDPLQGAVMGAAAGLVAPHLLTKLFTGGLAKGVQTYTMGAILSSPVSLGKAYMGAYGGALMAAASKAAAGKADDAARILAELNPTKFIPRAVEGFRNPAPLGGFAQDAPSTFQKIYGAFDTAARAAMQAGGFSADDAARFTLSGQPSTEIGGKALGALSGDRPIDFALRLIINAFPRVGIQSLERGIEFSPLGLVPKLAGKASTAGSTAERVARAAIGTTGGALAYASSDQVPLWLQPLLVAASGPAGLPIAAGLAAGDARRTEPGQKITAALEQIGYNAPVPRYGLTEGVKQFLSGSQFVPNVVGGAARAMDPYERENEGFFGRTIAKIPGKGIGPIPGRETLPIRGQTVNLAGQPIEKRGPLERFASGSRIPREPMKGIPEGIAGEIQRLGIEINPPAFQKSIEVGRTKVDVPPDVAERARATRREHLVPAIERVMASSVYKQADDARKKRLLERAISRAERRGSRQGRSEVRRALRSLNP